MSILIIVLFAVIIACFVVIGVAYAVSRGIIIIYNQQIRDARIQTQAYNRRTQDFKQRRKLFMEAQKYRRGSGIIGKGNGKL